MSRNGSTTTSPSPTPTSPSAAGEFFSMLGPSGCGKTTTLRMIAGFESPTEGAIRLEGVDVSRVPPHKRNVNTVFQHYALFPHMTVWDNVAYGPRSQKKDKAKVKQERRRDARGGPPHRLRPAQARPALRRPATARRAGPGAGQLPQRPAARRAARRPRPQIAPRHAVRTQAHPARGRHHVRLRDPRPGRSADDERPDRGHEPGNVEQIGTPTEIYDRPATVFVAGFIGQANLWHGRQTGRDQPRLRRGRGARHRR